MGEQVDFECLVKFKCALKIYTTSGTQDPKVHSCTFSLGELTELFARQPCFQVEGSTVRFRRVKFKGCNIVSVNRARLLKGTVSISLSGLLQWDNIVISEVKDQNALFEFCSHLDRFKNETLNTRGDHCEMPSPSPGNRSHRDRTYSLAITGLPQSDGQKKPVKSLSLARHPNNWRGARMVEASRAKNKSATKASSGSFYGSSVSATPPDAFVPRQASSLPSRKFGSSYNFSARRNLAPDLDRQNGGVKKESEGGSVLANLERHERENDLAGWKEEDFKPQHKFFARRPLTDLSEKRDGNLSSSVVKPRLSSSFDFTTTENSDGFANLGNTCYMNAVLQSLLGMEPFMEDLLNCPLAREFSSESLYRVVHLLGKSKSAKYSFDSQRILLKKIKAAIARGAAKFGGYRQQDAHELLSQCLDQLKDEVGTALAKSAGEKDRVCDGDKDRALAESASSLCPVIRNFESEILHTITCKSCGKVSRKREINYNFSLQLPKSIFVCPTEQANLQQLVDAYFGSEEVEFHCEACHSKSATIRHQLERLPRIMILHLKRYGYSTELSRNSKRVDNIRIPRSINIAETCASEFTPPCTFSGRCSSVGRASMGRGSSVGRGSSMGRGSAERSLVERGGKENSTPPHSSPAHSGNAMPTNTMTTPTNLAATPTHFGGATPTRPVIATPTNLAATPTHPVNIAATPTNAATSPTPFINATPTNTAVVEPKSSNHTSSPSQPKGGSTIRLGKRRSSERSDALLSSPSSSPSKVSRVTDTDANIGGSLGGDKKTNEGSLAEFDRLVAESPDFLTALDQAATGHSSGANVSNHCDTNTTASSSVRPWWHSSPVTTPTDQGGIAMSEEDNVMKAVQESLKEPNHFQLLGMSEEEQLKLAMELSMQEALEAPPTSSDVAPPPSSTQDSTNDTSQSMAYRLVGIVSHIGRGTAGGHYISDVYSVSEHNWKTYNDSMVFDVREEEVRQRRQTTGYIFFYMHRSIFSVSTVTS